MKSRILILILVAVLCASFTLSVPCSAYSYQWGLNRWKRTSPNGPNYTNDPGYCFFRLSYAPHESVKVTGFDPSAGDVLVQVRYFLIGSTTEMHNGAFITESVDYPWFSVSVLNDGIIVTNNLDISQEIYVSCPTSSFESLTLSSTFPDNAHDDTFFGWLQNELTSIGITEEIANTCISCLFVFVAVACVCFIFKFFLGMFS